MSTNTTGEVSENATALDPPFENQDTANEPESETAGAKPQAGATLPRKARATREKGRGNARSRRLSLLHSEAAKFPNGPAAKALASAEPRMPREVEIELANSSDPKILTESFEWLLSRIRDYHRPSKGTKGKALYPANLVREYRSAYGNGRSEAFFIWLREWVSYLRDTSRPLRKGEKYAADVDPVRALGVTTVAQSPRERLDALTKRMKSPLGFNQPASKSLPASAGYSPAAAYNTPSPASPPAPRRIPSQFTHLQSAIARNFVSAYRDDPHLEKVKQAARALASDRLAIAEIRAFGPEAESFLINTMQKLGIPLS